MTTARRSLNYDPSVNPDTRAQAHVEDPAAYGKPDAKQLSTVGHNATVIPRANGHKSLGWDNFPTVVNVDPTDPVKGTGGITIDLERLDSTVVDSALSKATSADDAWSRVSSIQKAPMKAPRVVPAAAPPVAPAAVPPADQTALLAALGALPGVSPPPVQAPAPPPDPIVTYAPPAAAGSDTAEIKQQITALTAVVRAMAQAQMTQPTRSEEQDPRPSPEKDRPAEPPLQSLGLGYLGEGDAVKPQVPVYFDLGVGGQLTTKFHQVLVQNGLMVLVYDTRWDGVQYMPPRLQQAITVKLPETKSTHKVLSEDCTFSLGKLDLCVLVVIDDKHEEPEDAGPTPVLAPRQPRSMPPLPVPLPRQQPHMADAFEGIALDGPPDEEDLPPII